MKKISLIILSVCMGLLLCLIVSFKFITPKMLSKNRISSFLVEDFSFFPPTLHNISINFDERSSISSFFDKSYISAIEIQKISIDLSLFKLKNCSLEKPIITLNPRSNPIIKKNSQKEKKKKSKKSKPSSFLTNLKIVHGKILYPTGNNQSSILFHVQMENLIDPIPSITGKIIFENFELPDYGIKNLEGSLSLDKIGPDQIKINLISLSGKLADLSLHALEGKGSYNPKKSWLDFDLSTGQIEEGFINTGKIKANEKNLDLAFEVNQAQVPSILKNHSLQFKGKIDINSKLTIGLNPLKIEGFSIASLKGKQIISLPKEIKAILSLINLSFLPGKNPFTELTINTLYKDQLIFFNRCHLSSQDYSISCGGQLDYQGNGKLYSYSDMNISNILHKVSKGAVSGNILEKIPGLSQLISLSTHLIESLVNVITSQIKCIRIDMKEWQAKSTTVIPFSKGKTEFPALEKMLEDDIKKRTSKKK